MIKYLLVIFFVILSISIASQNKLGIEAMVNVESKSIIIQQQITFYNTSNNIWESVYLNDWNNSYSTKKTPLAKRFEEEFNTKFHLAKQQQRGHTTITSIVNKNDDTLTYAYLKAHPDILKVQLKHPVKPGNAYTLNLSYTLVLPDASFTDYGFTKKKEFNLKYWYITPTNYTNKWNFYSNKDLDDLFVPKSDIDLAITYPNNYEVVSELDKLSGSKNTQTKTTTFSGKDRVDTFMSIRKSSEYEVVETEILTLKTDIREDKIPPVGKALIAEKILRYLHENLGDYPHKKLLASKVEYRKNPLYGLNQLPDFLRPFPDDFQYELKLLKTTLKNYVTNSLLINPRKDYWVSEGIQIYLLMKYIDEFYPNVKLFGGLADVWGLRSFHGADLNFNFKYYLYFMEMARKNRDQPLTTSKDSLIKFNANIANKYKAGLGLRYLNDYAEDLKIDSVIKNFVSTNKLHLTTPKEFENTLKQNTQKDIDWFFDDYVNSRGKIDFKIKRVETENDSVKITVKNKRSNSVPIPLFSMVNDTITNKLWIENITDEKTITLPKGDTEKFVLDQEDIIPEFNKRDNYKSINNAFFNKPLQFRLFKDFESPNYNQVFLMPLIQFNNIYDGITLGGRFYNKAILRRRLNYRIVPQYATRSKALTGGGSVFYTHNLENQNLFNITYGISAGYQSFAQDAFFTRIRPSIEFLFRDDNDFRKDTRDRILARYISIQREIGEDAILDELTEEPDYGVFNLRYQRFKPGLINFYNFNIDFQLSNNFSKLSTSYEIRKLTKSNRNIYLRFFAGAFLSNNTESNFFDFALDRPTDYLFDFKYLGRSENSGLTSQQLIIADGGFKSQLETDFANQWITTLNGATSIWRYIHAYGDVGLVKNRFEDPKFVYDSGIRLNLVEDYLEFYFPIYSNNGWEITQPNYDKTIRFILTIDYEAIVGLFTRKWY